MFLMSSMLSVIKGTQETDLASSVESISFQASLLSSLFEGSQKSFLHAVYITF